MSRHSVVYDVTTKTIEELIELYGIEIDDNGTVFDPCEGERYGDIHSWAATMDEEQDRGGFSRGTGKQIYWDD